MEFILRNETNLHDPNAYYHQILVQDHGPLPGSEWAHASNPLQHFMPPTITLCPIPFHFTRMLLLRHYVISDGYYGYYSQQLAGSLMKVTNCNINAEIVENCPWKWRFSIEKWPIILHFEVVEKKHDGLFAPACLAHCLDWQGPKISGVTHAAAVGGWYFNRSHCDP